jgi:chromate reductase
MTKIAVLVGSLRIESINRALAKSLEALAPIGVSFIYPSLNLPLYRQELEEDLPAEVEALKITLEAADGVLIVTPEYNRSFPGVLKNAIDWASRPWGHNSFKDKPTGIVGASASQTGTAQAQSQLRSVMVYLETKLMGQPELYVNTTRTFDKDNNILESSKDYLKSYISAFVSYIESNKKR